MNDRPPPPDEMYVDVAAPGRRTGNIHRAKLWYVSTPEPSLELLAHRRRSGRRPDWLLNALAAGGAQVEVGEWRGTGRLEPLTESNLSRLLGSFAEKYGSEQVRRWYDGESLEPVRVVLDWHQSGGLSPS